MTKYKTEDFVFDKMELPYHDYWFNISGESKEFLADKYREQSMVEINAVVYSVNDDVLGVKRIFPFNFDVIAVDEPDLKQILLQKIETISELSKE